MTFARLRGGDWVAFVAALALLLVMSVDWYSTDAAEAARDDAALTKPMGGPASTETAGEIDKDAEIVANRHEKNAWQAGAFADRLVLLALLATIGLAIAAAFARAFGLRPRLSPSALAALFGLGSVLLLAARILQKPSAEAGAVVKAGAPLGLACLVVLAIGARAAWRSEGATEERDDGRATIAPAGPAVGEDPAWAPDWSDPRAGGPRRTGDSHP